MKKNNIWIWVTVIAALVAAATTVAVLVLRAPKKAEDLEPIYDCGCCDDLDCICCDEAAAEVTE